MAVGAREHVVVLIPGFFPFAKGAAKPGNASSCHVATVLRSALEAFYGLSIPVVTLPFLPSLDLAARQRMLLRQLQELDGTLRGVRHFHLVGHGPGGLDAELLSSQYPLRNSATWLDLDPTQVRDRLASIITVAAPHQGTQLLSDPVRQLGPNGTPMATRLRQEAELLSAFARSVLVSLRPRHSLADLKLISRCMQLLRGTRAARALAPRNMQRLRARNRPDTTLDVSVENVVVLAPEISFERAGVARRRDKLFAALHVLTAQSAGPDSTNLNLTLSAKMLRSVPAHRIVRGGGARMPAFDLAANDGLVNAAYQVHPARGGANILALALADHADVIGYHASPSPLKGRSQDAGLFRSGSSFGDDEFFALWRHVAAHIASVARASVDAPLDAAPTEAAAQ